MSMAARFCHKINATYRDRAKKQWRTTTASENGTQAKRMPRTKSKRASRSPEAGDCRREFHR